MDNYSQEGEVLTLTAPTGGVTSGQGYLIGSVVVVATMSAEADEKFTGVICGVVKHAKTSAQQWTEGLKIYFNPSLGVMTSSGATGNYLVGVAAAAAANPSATGYVRLDGVVRGAVA